MAELPSRARPIALAIATAILAIGALHYWAPQTEGLWRGLMRHLFVLPVVVAGLFFGWMGGLAAAALAWLCFLPNLAWETTGRAPAEGIVAEAIDIAVVGLVTGILAGMQNRQKRTLERTTQKLSAVYQELQENYERSKRAERLYAIGQLSAGFAHELRNPLASVLGAAGVLQRNQASAEKQRECLDIVVRETHRLDDLLTRFLDFARPRAPRRQAVEASRLLESVTELAAHAVHGRAISLRTAIDPRLHSIECDPVQMRQVLLNLLINAIQAMPDGGEVEISALSDGGRAVIAVRDQGQGVSPEHLDRIFDPFFTTKESGTGLGLPVAHQIVAQHGGVLTAAANPSGGMTFSVTLPVHSGEKVRS